MVDRISPTTLGNSNNHYSQTFGVKETAVFATPFFNLMSWSVTGNKGDCNLMSLRKRSVLSDTSAGSSPLPFSSTYGKHLNRIIMSRTARDSDARREISRGWP